MKIKKLDLITIIISVMLVHTSLIQRITSWQGFFYIRWMVAVMLGVFLIFNIKVILKNNVKIINMVLFVMIILFCGCSIYSSYLNRSGNMFHVGFFNIIIFLDTFGVLKYIKEINRTEICVETIFKILLVYCIINDVLMIIAPNSFYGNGKFILYSKFYAVYLHMVLVVLYASKRKSNKKYLILLWAVALIVSSYMQCSTGVQGFILLFVLYFLPDGTLNKLRNPIVAIIIMIASSLFLILQQTILSQPLIQHVITGILGESSDLNSRVYIYRVLYKIININPLWGFGAENNYAACQKYLVISTYESAPDAQNGLVDWIVSYGMIGTVVLLFILFLCFLYVKKKNNNRYLLSLVYVFFVLGSVEIVFDSIFFFILIAYVYLECPDHSKADIILYKNKKRMR